MSGKRPLLDDSRRSSDEVTEQTAVDEASALLSDDSPLTLADGDIIATSATATRKPRPASFWRQFALFVWATTVTAAFIVLAVYFQHARDTGGGPASRKRPASGAAPAGKRNLIFMVSDGMGPASLSLTRSFRQHVAGLPLNDTLVLDRHLLGSSRTRSASSLITDSAAGATAFSCAAKSYNGAISVLPPGTAGNASAAASPLPCGSVLEAAKLAGYTTGLVVTTRLTDATPACFAAHARHRTYEDLIAAQMAGLAGAHPLGRVVDLLLGGGRCHFLPNTTDGSCRADATDVVGEAARAHGWTYVADRAGFDALRGGAAAPLPLLGLLAPGDIPFEIDRRHRADIYPSLEETTRTALRALAAATSARDAQHGFFLMVEGSRIDHAGHGNDPAAQVHEVLAYDRAFAAVLDWIANEADPAVPTLLVSTSDHETGGLSVARQLTEVYPEYRWYPEVLAKAKHSSEFLAARVEEIIEEAVGDGDAAAVDSVLLDPSVRAHIKRELIEEGLGITDVSEEELDALVASYQDVNTPPNLVLADIISRRAQIGWSSHGHSAVDVNIYASSADAAAPLRGNHENTEVGQFLADYLAVDTAAVTDKLRGMRTRGGAGSGDGAVDEYAWLGPALDSDYRVDALDHYHGEFKRRRRHLHGGGCECGN